MLHLLGHKVQLCDRLPRRDFLTVGSLAMGGACLPELLRAEEAAPPAVQLRACLKPSTNIQGRIQSEAPSRFTPSSRRVPLVEVLVGPTASTAFG